MKGMVLVAMLFVAASALARPGFSDALPILGTTFKQLPAGEGKTRVEAACMQCHSADILVQQRLTEKQWTANVEKMMRWGAIVADADKATMIQYLAKNFGPQNKFTPTKVRPAVESRPSRPQSSGVSPGDFQRATGRDARSPPYVASASPGSLQIPPREHRRVSRS
jgi:hypothetical protein